MKFLLYMMVLAWFAGSTVAETFFVPAGGDIQSAIDQSSSGDVIQLEAGTYPAPVPIRPYGRAIVIRGVKVEGVNASVINANGLGRVIECASGEGQGTRFENLWITGGDADGGGGMPATSAAVRPSL